MEPSEVEVLWLSQAIAPSQTPAASSPTLSDYSLFIYFWNNHPINIGQNFHENYNGTKFVSIFAIYNF